MRSWERYKVEVFGLRAKTNDLFRGLGGNFGNRKLFEARAKKAEATESRVNSNQRLLTPDSGSPGKRGQFVCTLPLPFLVSLTRLKKAGGCYSFHVRH